MPGISDLPNQTKSSAKGALRVLMTGALALPLAFGGALFAQDADAVQDEAPASEAAASEEAAGGGYITEDQVATGKTSYEQRCGTCHGQDLIGSIAGYPTAWLFYSYASTAMPADAPGSLQPQQYADIVAYLLSENGHPATGSEPLPPDQAVLETIDPDAPEAGDEPADEEPAAE